MLAVGTWGSARTLGIEGEDLPFVTHRGCDAEPEAVRGESPPPKVLVVGAGLSAADCVVHLLSSGATVHHAFRGRAEATKVWSKFAGAHMRASYPEYVDLAQAMRSTPVTDSAGGMQLACPFKYATA